MADLDLPEMEPLEDETVFWDTVFGTPAGCNMVFHLTSIQDVLSMRVTSKNFSQLALICVEHMRSNNTVQVPLSTFTNYSQLKSVHNVFFTIFTEDDARAISTIPKLVKANFLFREASADLLNLFIQNLTSLATGIDPLTDQPYSDIREITGMDITIGFVTEDNNLESVVAISNGKALIPLPTSITSMAYRLLSAIGQILVQRNEILEVYYLNGSHNVSRYNWTTPAVPGLTVHNNSEFTNNAAGHQLINNSLQYVRLDMINFLQQAQLGLFNPSIPPSDENKPLKTYIPLTMDGVTSLKTIYNLLNIYIFYTERLRNLGNKSGFHFNDLMRQHLSQYVPEIYSYYYHRRRPNNPPVLMDIMRFAVIREIVRQSLVTTIDRIAYKDVAHMNQSLDALNQHAIIPLEESGIVLATYNIYNQLRVAGSSYYLEDGTTAQR